MTTSVQNGAQNTQGSKSPAFLRGRPRNNHVLVFGGGSGIGKAIARRMLDAGASVTICGRNAEKLRAVREEFASEKLFSLTGDISAVDDHGRLFKEAETLMGGLDAFVNAAAIGGDATFKRGYEPWDITSAEWDLMAGINFKAAFFLIRNEVDFLKGKGRRGNILNLASNAACMDVIGSYGAAKLAIIKWTRAFGKRFGHDGIVINGIAPGATVTPMIAAYAKSENQPYPRHALERFIRPDEIAELAFYLLSDYGEIICGHTVVADAGDNCATL